MFETVTTNDNGLSKCEGKWMVEIDQERASEEARCTNTAGSTYKALQVRGQWLSRAVASKDKIGQRDEEEGISCRKSLESVKKGTNQRR